jgi:hypothetical protein
MIVIVHIENIIPSDLDLLGLMWITDQESVNPRPSTRSHRRC